MPRIPVHTLQSAPEESRDALRALEAKMGKVPNIHGEMAHSPVVIQSYAAMQRSIGDFGTFDARTREAIALAVGNVDNCSYCQSAHTVSAKAAGFSDEQTVAIREDDVDFDPRLETLLKLAREIAANVGEVRDDTWRTAMEAGWSDVELTELAAHVVVNLFTNYFNHFAGTDPDVPRAAGL